MIRRRQRDDHSGAGVPAPGVRPRSGFAPAPALLERILEDVRDVVMVVARDGRILYANGAAAELLARRGPLQSSQGRIRSSSEVPELTLRRAIERACNDDAPSTQAVVMHHPDQVPLVVVVKCVETVEATRHALLLTFDSHPHGDRLIGPLRECFGLTRSEAEVSAAIAEGATISQIAARRKVAVSTIRTQVKHISAKLGCTRQSQIAAIVKAVPLAPQHGA
jgi:DNA-binding CsgD family transcriptional regulator